MSDKERVGGGGGGGGKHKLRGDEGRKEPSFRLRKGEKLVKVQKGISLNSKRLGGGGGGGGWCCWCLKEPGTLDALGESPTVDPNGSGFSFGMLRNLIEKNDFSSKECNPHMEADKKST